MITGRPQLVARADELAVLREYLDGDGDAFALCLEGEAGIGKTELWQAGVDLARERGMQVRVSRPAEAEAGFSFAVIADLLGETVDEDEVVAALPGPQREALETALLRRSADGQAVAAHAVAAGFLTLARAIAGTARLLIAVDDVQWCDPASAAVLGFALRRVEPADRIRVLVSRRAGDDDEPRPAVDPLAALRPGAVQVMRVGPLSFGAAQRLILARTGWAAPRRLARRIHETSGGNPLFTLELARLLQTTGERFELDGSLPLPDTLDAVLAQRFERQDVAVEHALLAVALLAEASERHVVAAFDSARGVEDALSLGQLVRDGLRLRLRHPLLGLAARRHASPADQRAPHLRLAEVVDDPEAQARHLALGTLPPDEAVADRLADAAESAATRSAWVASAELSELAWHYTPLELEWLRAERAVLAGRRLIRVGANERGDRVIKSELEHIPAGPLRAQARLQLTMATDAPNADPMFEAALLDADHANRAEILAERSFNIAADELTDLSQAAAMAGEAVELAGRTSDPILRCVCEMTLCWIEALRGQDVDGRLDAIPARGADAVRLFDHPDRVRVVRALWRGETGSAREWLDRLAARAAGDEDEWSLRVVLVHRFELESRIGDWRAAEAVCDELELASQPYSTTAAISQHRCRALLAAARGDKQALDRHVAAVFAEPSDRPRWQKLEAMRVVGFGALLAGDHRRAADALANVRSAVAAAGITDPGVFPVAPYLVQALLGCGERDAADEVASELDAAARAQDHPWAYAASARSRGLLAADEQRLAEAAAALEEAGERYAALGLLFDAARTRLALGAVLRRARRISAAREHLVAAHGELDRAGCAQLAGRAEAELSRLGGRGRAGVTGAELRVAQLVAEGRTNREIAATLVVSVSTVEAHLTRIYAKLGIRSRTELARRVLAGLPL